MTSNGFTFQIWRVSQDGTNIQVLLDKEDGINRPRFLRSDKNGEQLTVINEFGYEIRNYNIYKVIYVLSELGSD